MIDLIACLGLHWILRYGSILNWPRNLIFKITLLKSLFNCSLCLGFWVGLLYSLVSDVSFYIIPFASAAFCWFFDNLNNLIQRMDLKLENSDDS